MKPTLYLDTTIPSYLFDERDSIKLHIEITRKWWAEERGNFDIWASGEVLNEITAGKYPKKNEISKFASAIPILSPNSRVVDIARIYLENHLMPRVLKGDSLHLAYASFYRMGFLLTWNCNHLANANKRKHIRVINARLGLPTPEIVTPLELFSETIDDYE